jgi:CHAD domain-containing protein
VKASRERELKLSAPASLRLPRLDGILDGVTAVERERVRLLATYLDTGDLRLARAGVTLRHRTGEGWTVKLPAEEDEGLLVRTELSFPGSAQRPAPVAVDLVRAYARSEPLAPRARLRTGRRVIELRDAAGTLLAEVCDDRVAVLDGGRVTSSFREIEVEVGPAAAHTGLVARVAEALRKAGAEPSAQKPKLVQALGPRAEEPDDLAPGGTRVETVGELVAQALAASAARLVAHDPVVRIDADPEGVHQMRVATRRLRSDLRTFAPFVDSAWARELRAELGRLAELLGAVRDADVLLERLRGGLASLPSADRHAAGSVLASLVGQREQALAALLEELRSDRYVELLDRLVAAVREPMLTPAAGERAKEALPTIVRARWRGLDRSVRSVEAAAPIEALHALRIRTKRCRYAVEAAAPALGKGADAVAFARRLGRLQDRLGELNDAASAQRWLRAWSRGRRGTAAFAAGELAALEGAAAEAARKRWRRAWKAAAAAVPAPLR